MKFQSLKEWVLVICIWSSMDLSIIYFVGNMSLSPMNLPTELMPVFFFVWHAISICKSIGDYITDELTDIIQITDNMFFDDIFSFVILLLNLSPIELLFKHW